VIILNEISYITGHPKLGASWEGFAIEELMKALQPDDAYFWNIPNQAELDLLIFQDGKRQGYEFKYSYTPEVTRSSRMALKDLKLSQLTIIIPQGEPYKVAENIMISGLSEHIRKVTKPAI